MISENVSKPITLQSDSTYFVTFYRKKNTSPPHGSQTHFCAVWGEITYSTVLKSHTETLSLQNGKANVSSLALFTTPILKSYQWFKINERIKYKILSLCTFKLLYTTQHSYLYDLISLHTPLICRHSCSPNNLLLL